MTKQAKQIAKETLDAIETKSYINKYGEIIDLSSSIDYAINCSILYGPGHAEIGSCFSNPSPNISVVNKTTLDAAINIQEDTGETNVCILNFASAKNPGGGFIEGAIAQEESIARSSTLYPTLLKNNKFYEENKKKHTMGLYLDYAIYSPSIAIFRTNDGDWYDFPYYVSVVTSPAPNYNAVPAHKQGQVESVIYNRIKQILGIMAFQEHRTIVLGAWGCGAFGNDPEMVAKLFKSALKEMPYFDNIIFAIYDKEDSETYLAFQSEFGKLEKVLD
jgi:uncharacterized protein (TIGR02452 family)